MFSATLREWKRKIEQLRQRWRAVRQENERLRKENEVLRRREKQWERERERLREENDPAETAVGRSPAGQQATSGSLLSGHAKRASENAGAQAGCGLWSTILQTPSQAGGRNRSRAPASAV